MHVNFTWRMARDPAELFAAVQSHDADVAVGAIVITPEREAILDFSLPFLDSGLRIMVPTDSQRGVVSTIVWSIPWMTVGHLLAAAIIILLVLANLLWLIQRRRDEGLSQNYLSGVGEVLWRIMRTIAAAEYGDTDAPGVMKRIGVVLVWLLGVVIIAQLTASLTSFQTIDRLKSGIRGPEYWAAKAGHGVVEVVGPMFRPEKYAMAVANGSALRKQIDDALPEIY